MAEGGRGEEVESTEASSQAADSASQLIVRQQLRHLQQEVSTMKEQLRRLELQGSGGGGPGSGGGGGPAAEQLAAPALAARALAAADPAAAAPAAPAGASAAAAGEAVDHYVGPLISYFEDAGKKWHPPDSPRDAPWNTQGSGWGMGWKEEAAAPAAVAPAAYPQEAGGLGRQDPNCVEWPLVPECP